MKNIHLHGKLKCFCWAAMLAASLVLFGCPNKVTVKPKTYTVSFNVVGNTGGKLTATVDGGAETKISPITVEEGKTVTFTATAETGYEVTEWTGVVAGKDNKNSAKLTVSADKTVTVKFKKIESQPPVVPNGNEYDVDSVKFTMINIDAVANVTLGAKGQDKNPPHTVTLTAYKIGETVVTQELWMTVMDKNPSFFDNTGLKNGKDTAPAEGEEQKKRPVEEVNWYHAVVFCNKLSLKLGLQPCYSNPSIDLNTAAFDAIPISKNDEWAKTKIDMAKNGFRLPTEAEWE